MGGLLEELDGSPAFFIEATKDPLSAHLDRIQMVKGWLEEGESREKVYDVVWSGDREGDAAEGIRSVRDTVDSETGTYSNAEGAATLASVWIDPDFDPAQSAFYYARVLEVPTPRHSTIDAIRAGIPASETGQALSIQERAYSSPIHYRSH